MWVWLEGVLLLLLMVGGHGDGVGVGDLVVSSSRVVVFGGVGAVVVVEGWRCYLLILRGDGSCLVSALSWNGKVDC